MVFTPRIHIRNLYDSFDAPLVPFDCGEKCAPHNPSGKPFCCDICHAVPAVYHQEWEYLQLNTDLWHAYRGDECPEDTSDPEVLFRDTPDHMLLLACLGPSECQRPFRAVSCRQFPFFPYVTSDLRFIGLAYEWGFEQDCWVISNLNQVTDEYRAKFVRVYDVLFANWAEELEGYALKSEEMRDHFLDKRRRIPVLHRNGGAYLLSPGSERLRHVQPERLPRFGVYKSK